ncbi:NUDIX hydrolase [Paraburkholderia sp. UCT31]|uniref:NUDIX hydrolase n=1 Tax=Paraburkholderia sp. UCT31 TaxID=2615209 RepID=UPI001654F76F|nr:NUDIX domain-containing protein [Paraburkholderia sp. UCT31]MBC8742036.1 NUDIX hydrolase [Paraburkholderia sp. UCT31]
MSKLITTVDVVLLTLMEDRLQVVLQRRPREPFKGELALPGGYIHDEEDASTFAAATRVLLDKTGITSPYLEQLYTFSGPDRDPRGWSMSVAHYALVHRDAFLGDGKDIALYPVDELPALAFDHNEIVDYSVERVRGKSSYSTLPLYLMPAEFTRPELQRTYESVLGRPLDKSSFFRKVSSWGIVEEVAGAFEESKGHKRGQLYRIKPGASIELFQRSVFRD